MKQWTTYVSHKSTFGTRVLPPVDVADSESGSLAHAVKLRAMIGRCDG